LGDGECDNACNSEACNFDGGDCEGIVSIFLLPKQNN
jgi:hypothetical protein